MENLPKIDSEKAAAILARLREEREQAARAKEQALADIAASRMAVEEGAPNASRQLTEAHKAYARAQTQLTESEVALTALQARYGDLKQAEDQAEEGRQWKKAGKLADALLPLSEEIERDIDAVIEKLDRLKKLSMEFYEAVPFKTHTLVDFPLAPGALEDGFRMLIRKHRRHWAGTWLSDEREITGISKKVTDGVSMLMSKAPKFQRDKEPA